MSKTLRNGELIDTSQADLDKMAADDIANPPVERMRASMIAEISAIASGLEDGYVMLDGNPIPTDLVAQGRITSARATLNRRGTGTVKFAGMGVLDEATLTAMEDAVFDKVTAIQNRHSDLYDELVVAEDPSTVDINTGWPA